MPDDDKLTDQSYILLEFGYKLQDQAIILALTEYINSLVKRILRKLCRPYSIAWLLYNICDSYCFILKLCVKDEPELLEPRKAFRR